MFKSLYAAVFGSKTNPRSRVRKTRKLSVEALEGREVPAAIVLPETIVPAFSATSTANGGGSQLTSGGNFLGSLNGNTPLTVSYSLDISSDFVFFAGTASFPNAAVTADGTAYGHAVPNAGAISWLITNLGPSATTPEKQDALQAAIWRTEYGTGFQLDGVDNGNTLQPENATIASLYRADLTALGRNTAPVSAASWITPGTDGFSTLQRPALVALAGAPVAQTPVTLALPPSDLPTFAGQYYIREGGQTLLGGNDLSGGNFGRMLNGNIPLTESYCVNVYTNLFPATTYAHATLTHDGTTYANAVPNAGAIAWLLLNLAPSATTAIQQDALQAAIWRTEYGNNFQLQGVDNNDGAPAFNAQLAPYYKADLAALGSNTAPVSAVTWISPGANPDGTQGQALVALTGPAISNGGGGSGGGSVGGVVSVSGGGKHHHHHHHHPHHHRHHHG